MIKSLKEGAIIPDMIELLKSDGVFLINEYVSGDFLSGLYDEVLNLCESQGGHYEFGRNYRGPSLKSFSTDSYTYKLYDSDWMRTLDKIYRGTNTGFCGSIYATHDYKNDKGLARNGWLHFDRNNCLKFFVYLTDVDKTNGAFSCSVGSRSKGEELRKKAWVDNLNYGDVKNRINLDYPTLNDIYPPEPIEAKAGTLIVFDTDTFHKGGECEDGKERLVIRAHCF